MSKLPKYSYAIVWIQMACAIACIVLVILGEYKLYVYLVCPLIIVSVIQFYRLRRVRHQIEREHTQLMQIIAKHQNKEPILREPQPNIADALEDLREEIKRHRRAKDELQ